MANPRVLEVKITEGIGGWGFTFSDLVERLRGFKGEKIVVPINSYGGSVLDGLAIYNTLIGRSEQITTKIIGYGLSMGSVLFMAGEERIMPENSYLMIHNPRALTFGDEKEHSNRAELLKAMQEDLLNIYAKRTKYSKKKLRQMMNEETWLTAQQALEMGFATSLSKGVEFEASVDLGDFQNVPVNLKNSVMKKTWKEKFQEGLAVFSNLLNDVEEVEASVETTVEDDVETTVEDAVETTVEANAGTTIESGVEIPSASEDAPAFVSEDDMDEVVASMTNQFTALAGQITDLAARIKAVEQNLAQAKVTGKIKVKADSAPALSNSEKVFVEKAKVKVGTEAKYD